MNPLLFEEGLVGLSPPRAMILLRDIRQTLLTPFATIIPVGKQKTGRGVFTRCDEQGAGLTKQREVFGLVATTNFVLTIDNPIQVFGQDPQIDAFSFRFVTDDGFNTVIWVFGFGPSTLLEMGPATNYFRWVKAKQLIFGKGDMMGPNCICQLKTYRYE